ncbi:hypothetical protein Mgra_00009841, partial [Meloidogyne graminicola]
MYLRKNSFINSQRSFLQNTTSIHAGNVQGGHKLLGPPKIFVDDCLTLSILALFSIALLLNFYHPKINLKSAFKMFNNNNNIRINISSFFDWCGNRPRMLALIGLLLIEIRSFPSFTMFTLQHSYPFKYFFNCSLFIIFLDSTVENTVNNKISEEEKKQNSFCISKIAPTNLTTNFTISVVQDCQKCSDFEKKCSTN